MTSKPTTAEQAVEIFLARRRSGELVEAAAFAAEHRELEPDLSSALGALLALERVTPEETVGDASLPAHIGAFRIVREIGHGGMGVVLEAIEERLNRRVALKVLPPELLASPSARSRFRREAELAARLDHSGIATIYGAGMEDERPWIAMRYVEGSTLATSIAAARDEDASSIRLSAPRAGSRPGTRVGGRDATLAVASLIAKVARALYSAHEQGIVHRDIKPSNVIVQPDGSPVLLDFGLAIAEDPDGRSLTRTGEAPGTPAYLAPETVSGDVERPDAQGDVYALGVTLYECLTLRRPFEAPTRAALYRAILSESPVDPRALNRGVSRDLAVVVSTAMERERARRYQSAQALAEDLEACVGGRPIAARPVPLHGRVLRWIRREPRQASLAGLLGAAAIALALFAGDYLASRATVRAAESVARERERERDLVAGFVALQQGKTSSDEAFLRVLASEPGNLEALAGRILQRVGKRSTTEALALLESAPKSPGFDALRAYCRRVPVDQDAEALRSPRLGALDLMLIGEALTFESRSAGLSRVPALSNRALAMMNEAVVRAPTAHAFMHILRSITAYEAGDERASRSAANALLALWPDAYEPVFAAGSALSVFDPTAAIPILERATTLDPHQAPAFQVLGNLYADIGQLEEAERWLWLALDRHRDAETYNSLGRSLALRECYDEAREAFSRAVAVDPGSERAWENLGYAELTTGHEEAGIFALERVLQIDPTRGLPRGNLGLKLAETGDLRGAREHLEYAVALEPDQMEWYSGLAEAFFKSGDPDSARGIVAAGLARNPKHGRLLELREFLAEPK